MVSESMLKCFPRNFWTFCQNTLKYLLEIQNLILLIRCVNTSNPPNPHLVSWLNLPANVISYIFQSAVSKDGGRVLLTACDTSSVHCLMQIFTAFFFIFWCLRLSVDVTSEMPSNDKPSLKDLESLLDSKLKPIHSRLDDLFKKVDDNYKALQARREFRSRKC